MSLRAKLLLPLLLVGLLMGGYLYAVWIPRTLAAGEAAQLTAMQQHLDSVVEGLIPLLLGNQLDIVHENLNALKKKNTAWVDIRLVNAAGRQLYPLAAASAPPPPHGPDMHMLKKPIGYLGMDLGRLTVQADLAPALASTRQANRELTFILFGMLLVLMATTMLTAEIAVRRPLHQLANAARRLAERDFDTPLPSAGEGEVGALAGSFATMRNDLRAYHDELRHEIAERGEAEEALRQLNQTLEQRVQEELAQNREKDHLLIQQSRLASMGEMVHNIAHQWRQPLNSLSLLISNIRDDFRFGATTAESLERDVASARRLIEKMSTTIDDFRDFFRPDREKTRFDVAEAVNEAVFIVGAALKNNHVELTADLPAGIAADGFPSQYAQAVLNLLANAKEAIVDNKVAD
ncbi:MAG: HAMP domain-containing protein, partial [Sulfuricella sp.]|nr:HAMP domain-containing protein [Sulfuricella sp.]